MYSESILDKTGSLAQMLKHAIQKEPQPIFLYLGKSWHHNYSFFTMGKHLALARLTPAKALPFHVTHSPLERPDTLAPAIYSLSMFLNGGIIIAFGMRRIDAKPTPANAKKIAGTKSNLLN